MDAPLPLRPLSILVAAIVAVVFDTLTQFSGGSALFLDEVAHTAASHYALFIPWFNFPARLAYFIAGIGLRALMLLDGMCELRTVSVMTLKHHVAGHCPNLAYGGGKPN